MNQGLQYELDAVMPTAQQTGLFPSIATFYDRAGGDNPLVDALGQVDLSNNDLEPVAGLEDIPCILAARAVNNPQQQGGRTQEYNFEVPQRHLLLNDFYAGILQRYLVNVDGTLYEITPGGMEPDSQGQMNRLAVRVYQL